MGLRTLKGFVLRSAERCAENGNPLSRVADKIDDVILAGNFTSELVWNIKELFNKFTAPLLLFIVMLNVITSSKYDKIQFCCMSMNANVIRKLQSPNFKTSRFSYLKLTKSFYLFIFFLLHFGILSFISGSRNIFFRFANCVIVKKEVKYT